MRRVLLALGAGLLLLAPAALAQDRKRATPTSPSESSWVKLCETPKVSGKDLLGKAQAAGVTTCLIFAERLDATTGARLLAVGIRLSEGRQTLTVVVPSRVDQRGMIVLIYPRSQWQRAERGELLEKHERDRLKPLKLEYTFCDAEQCAAETNATPELIKDMRSKGGLVAAVVRNKKIVLLPVSLSRFRAAYDGPATDSARFRAARDEVLRELRERNKQRGQPGKRAGDQEI